MDRNDFENITPLKAERLLNKNACNRSLREGVVERYATDMANGDWTLCTVPISIYADNEIADGQHRLWAVVQSGTTQKFIILRGLERRDGLNIDRGVSRTLVDNARISGTDAGLSNELLSVTRIFEYGTRSNPGGRTLSDSEKLVIIDRHREPCAWAVHNGPKGKGLRNGIVMAAMARAHVKEKDHERLQHFAKCYGSGFSDGNDDSAAIAFRNWVLTNPAFNKMEQQYREGFLKAQNAIWYFMRRRKLHIIKTVKGEAYPKPKAKGAE